METAAASNYSGKEAGPPPEAPAAQAAPRGSLGSLGSYAAALVSVLGVAGAAGVVCQVGQAAGWPFAGVAAVLVPTLLVCFRWLTAETMHVTDSAYDEAVDVHCRGSTVSVHGTASCHRLHPLLLRAPTLACASWADSGWQIVGPARGP